MRSRVWMAAAAVAALAWVPSAPGGLLDDLKEGARVLAGKGGTTEQRDVLGEMARVAGSLQQELKALQPSPMWQQVLHADAASLQVFVAPERLLLGQVQLSNVLAAPELGPVSLVDTRQGTLLWQFTPPPMPGATWQLLSAQPLLLAATQARKTLLQALDMANGAALWSRSFDGSVGLVVDQSNSNVLVAEGGRVSALGLTDGQPRWTRGGVAAAPTGTRLWLLEGGVLVAGARLHWLDARSGGPRWDAELASGDDAPPQVLPLPAGALVEDRQGVRLLALADGRALWGPRPLAGAVTAWLPSTDGRQVWAIARQARTMRVGAQDITVHADTLHALALADGQEAWRHAAAGELGSRPLEVGDAVWVSGRGSLLRLARGDGRLLGTSPLGGNAGFVAMPWPAPDLLAYRGGQVVLMRDTGTDAVVAAFDAGNGQLRWQQTTQAAQAAAPWTLQAETRQGLQALGALAVYERRQQAWWRDQLTISGNHDIPYQQRQPGSQNLATGFQFAAALLNLSAAVERGLARDAQAALVERKQIELAHVLQIRQSLAGGRFWVRQDRTRGDAAVIVDLDTGLRRDIVHSTFNYGMNSYGLVLPGLLASDDGGTLLAVGAGLDAARFERYVKFKFGLPYPSLLKFDLRAMPWRSVAADNAALVDAAGRGDLAAMEGLARRGASPDSAPNPTGRSALGYAAEQGRTEAVRWLLAQGADAKVWPAASTWSPIELAAMNGHAEVVRHLLQAGAPQGRALERATEFKRIEVVEVLKAAAERR
ncbi:MAG: PQQ-binding-like beta-propeller repeat protein [Burkholderiales bacterium]|nr:PQQ-binding-like beta-propeller repeat protein [Burkholderiales bacterium]